MAQVEVVNGDDFDLPRRYRLPPSKMEHEVHGPTQNGPGLVNGDEAGGAGDANEERERWLIGQVVLVFGLSFVATKPKGGGWTRCDLSSWLARSCWFYPGF